jgi:hypothetical protein
MRFGTNTGASKTIPFITTVIITVDWCGKNGKPDVVTSSDNHYRKPRHQHFAIKFGLSIVAKYTETITNLLSKRNEHGPFCIVLTIGQSFWNKRRRKTIVPMTWSYSKTSRDYFCGLQCRTVLYIFAEGRRRKECHYARAWMCMWYAGIEAALRNRYRRTMLPRLFLPRRHNSQCLPACQLLPVRVCSLDNCVSLNLKLTQFCTYLRGDKEKEITSFNSRL